LNGQATNGLINLTCAKDKKGFENFEKVRLAF